MDIKICLVTSNIQHEGSWCYIGTDYLKMRKLEKKINGTRVSLYKYIQSESKNQRRSILDWIERQREANNDSLHWWMTHLAGRNNAVSLFFNYLVHIAAIRSWVKLNKNTQGVVLIVCEDYFLLQSVIDNLKEDCKLKVGNYLIFRKFAVYAYYLSRASYMFMYQVCVFVAHALAAKKTKPIDLSVPEGEIHIIQQCLDNASFHRKGSLSCRYFMQFPQWLETNGKNVLRLPWLYNVNLPLKVIYHRLRESDCFVPQDWLNISDYFNSLFNGAIGFRSIKKNINYCGDLDVLHLIQRERLCQLGNGITTAKFWIYARALYKFTNKVKHVSIYSTYEAMFPEHIQTSFCKQVANNKARSIGYYHSIVTSDFLGYHYPHGEIYSQVFPDLIVTNGKIARNLLIKQGLPENRVVAGPALRQQFPDLSRSRSKNHRNAILVILSLITQAIVETIDNISALCDSDQFNGNFPILIKPHPMMSKSSILKLMGWQELPRDWEWYDGEIYEALAVSRCAIVISSAAIIDVVLSACIPCPMTCELDTPWNGLDIFQDEFELLKPISPVLLSKRLHEIFFARREYYDSQVEMLRNRLISGLNPVSDESMSEFLGF